MAGLPRSATNFPSKKGTADDAAVWRDAAARSVSGSSGCGGCSRSASCDLTGRGLQAPGGCRWWWGLSSSSSEFETLVTLTKCFADSEKLGLGDGSGGKSVSDLPINSPTYGVVAQPRVASAGGTGLLALAQPGCARSAGAGKHSVAVPAGAGLRADPAVPGDFGHRRCARDALRG